MKRYGFLYTIVAAALLFGWGCKQKTMGVMGYNRPSFEEVIGVKFTEVRRSFNTGLIFDVKGYQMTPSFRISFMSDDSAMVYNPGNKKFSSYKIYYDEDSIINVARIWFKPTIIAKDSMILRLLKVGDDSVLRMKNSLIYLKFYSENYLKKLPASKVAKLSAPTRKDTLYILQKAKTAGFSPDSAFGALDPVQMISRSPQVKVIKNHIAQDDLNGVDESINYLLPEFSVTVNKAYDDFNHSFYAVVDAEGKMHFWQPTIDLPEDMKDNYIRVMKGLMDGYLAHYVTIIPGKTLGIPHSSVVKIHMLGIK